MGEWGCLCPPESPNGYPEPLPSSWMGTDSGNKSSPFLLLSSRAGPGSRSCPRAGDTMGQWGPQTPVCSHPPTHTGLFRDCLFKPTGGHEHGLGEKKKANKTSLKKKNHTNETTQRQPGERDRGQSGAPSAMGTPCREPGTNRQGPPASCPAHQEVAQFAMLCCSPKPPPPSPPGEEGSVSSATLPKATELRKKINNAAGNVCAGEATPLTSPRGESSSWETQRKWRFLPGELPAILQLR